MPIFPQRKSTSMDFEQSDSDSPTDIELMQRIVQQEQQALRMLYNRYGNAVYSLALRILRTPGLAEEVTQDTFLKVWQRAERWDSNRGKLSSWLLTVARHTAIDRIRRENRRPTGNAMDLEKIAYAAGREAHVDTPQWENGQLLRSLMAKLPSEQAEVIELAFFQGMTHSELAEHLDLPLGTVKTRLRLGMQKLKRFWLAATG